MDSDWNAFPERNATQRVHFKPGILGSSKFVGDTPSAVECGRRGK